MGGIDEDKGGKLNLKFPSVDKDEKPEKVHIKGVGLLTL